MKSEINYWTGDERLGEEEYRFTKVCLLVLRKRRTSRFRDLGSPLGCSLMPRLFDARIPCVAPTMHVHFAIPQGLKNLNFKSETLLLVKNYNVPSKLFQFFKIAYLHS